MLKTVLKATTQPVTQAQAMAQCRLDVSADADQLDLVDRLIVAAARTVAHAASVTLQPTTFTQRQRCWPSASIVLETGPVRDVETVTYLDADGAEQTVDAADWFWVDTPEGGEVFFQPSFSAPALADRPDAVRVRFVAGFNDPDASGGDDALDLPEQAAQAVLLLVGDWYAHRETSVVGEVTSESKVGVSFDRLIGQIRVYR